MPLPSYPDNDLSRFGRAQQREYMPIEVRSELVRRIAARLQPSTPPQN